FPDINAVAFSYTISILGMLFLAYIICYLKTPEIFLEANIKKKEKHLLIKEIVTYSWPMMFFAIGYNIFYWIDTLSIGFFKSSIEVGWYNAAIPIALLFYIAPELFMQLFFPLIIKEYSNKKRKNLKTIKELSKQISKWIFIINLPFFILIFLFPETAINILFGKEYIVAENALRILSIGVFFISITRVSQHLILMLGKSKIALYNIIIASIINFILNIVLIQKYGINGAALATTISTIFLSLLFLFQANYYTSILPFRRKMFIIFIASLIPTIILVYMRKFLEINIITITIIAIIFLSLYILLVFIFKGFDSNDIEVLKSIKRKVINTKNRITHSNYDFS
ncbi:MAG: polysaccharide biosynthesis C-terminal domain-containing protein, partial [Candidatus Pacearchaeota archaeon]